MRVPSILLLGSLVAFAAPARAQGAEGDAVAAAADDAGSEPVDAAGADADTDAEAVAGDETVDDETADDDAAADDEADGEADPDADVEADADVDTEADADAPAAPPARWNEQRLIAWTLFAASVAVGVGGAITFAVGIDDLNSVENATGGAVWSSYEAAYERAPLLTGLGGVILGVGVAGTAVSAALLALWGEGGTWLTVAVGPSSVQVSGRF